MALAARGPKTYPLVGSVPELLKDPFAYFMDARREYGDVFEYRIGPRRLYFVSHPADVKHVLLDNYKNYRKHTAYDKIKPLVGEGLVTSEGDTWLKNRRLAQPVFHRQRINAFGAMMTEACLEMLERWRGYAESGEAFDLAPEMMRLTLSIVGRALFSTDVSSEAEDIGEALGFALEQTNRRTLAPVDIPPGVPTPNNLRYRRAVGVLDEVIYGIIDERRRTGEAASATGGDLLAMLLNARDADTGEQMSDKQLRDEAMTLFLAGHETTATALTWAFFLLSKFPTVAEQLGQEFGAVLGERDASAADLPDLPYTRQFVDEVLRLYPPVWVIGRQTLNEDVLPSGARLTAKTDVTISPYVVHRHPDFWRNPEGLEPTRFSPERSAGRHRFAYLPFGAGPRVCIGNNFALMEMVLTLATVLRRYRLDLAPGQTGAPQPQITLRPKNGLQMTLREV